jgi:hypothetical protein
MIELVKGFIIFLLFTKNIAQITELVCVAELIINFKSNFRGFFIIVRGFTEIAQIAINRAKIAEADLVLRPGRRMYAVA